MKWKAFNFCSAPEFEGYLRGSVDKGLLGSWASPPGAGGKKGFALETESLGQGTWSRLLLQTPYSPSCREGDKLRTPASQEQEEAAHGGTWGGGGGRDH